MNRHEHQSNASNTIHVDDLVSRQGLTHLVPGMTSYQSRNFALNPREGLKIPAFKNAQTPEALGDRVLHNLTLYLLHIAQVKDFRTLTHKVINTCCHIGFALKICQNWKHIIKTLHQSGI